MRKILTLLAVIAILGLTSCKKESKESNDPAICNSDWDIESETEYDALIAAYNAYVSNMSVENCIAYKEAFADYIEALEPFLECASWSAADLQELQEQIDESEDAMNQLNCE